MGNGCCVLAQNDPPENMRLVKKKEGERNFLNENTAMNKEDNACVSSSDGDKYVKFGPMVLKEPPCRIALLIASSVDDGFFSMQNMLAKVGWQSAVAACEEEAEERFSRLWPHLIIVDARKSSNASVNKQHQHHRAFRAENIIRKLRSFSEDDGTVILAVVDKSSSDERHVRELQEAGASKIVKCCPKALADELQWIERCVLPLQHRLRSCAALFAALEHVDSAIEITSADRVVQFVNSSYEQLTGCHKDEVLGTYSSDLRRKSLPKETASARAAHPESSLSNDHNHYKPHTSFANATSAAICCNEAEKSGNAASDSITSPTPPPRHEPPSSEKHTHEDPVEQLGWKCINVPGPSHHHCIQFVHLKPVTGGFDSGKNGFYRRPPSIRFTNNTVDTPVSEIIGLLREVQKRCEHDEEIQRPIQKVVKILNSTELYSPLITRFKQEDKVASDLFGGLVLNGPVPTLHRSRKTSLSETMRADTHKSVRTASGILRCMSPDVRAVLQAEETWQFDIFELERLTFQRPLVHLGMRIFQRWRVREFLQCSESCLRGWLEVIEAHYHPQNSYHNSTHAADVLQATAYYLGKDIVANMIEHADAVAALLASVIHDVDHPGKGSAFLINTKHPLALLYNDVSVLESHHAALGFQLTVSYPRINIFARLTRQDYTNLRKSVVDMVLATDMNKHFEYLAKFQQTVLTSVDDADVISTEKDRIDPRRIVCRILIKCADVSNPTRPWYQCKEWAYRIVDEYFVQTAEERAKGLPLTMEVFDRDTCNVPLTQCSFIDMFIREMFKSWAKFCDMPELPVHVEDNYRHWQEEAKIWPKQRATEYGKIQKYLKHRDSLRHINFVAPVAAGTGRSSIDSVGSGPSGSTATVAAPQMQEEAPVDAMDSTGDSSLELLSGHPHEQNLYLTSE